jgi:Fe-S oxidoreductase
VPPAFPDKVGLHDSCSAVRGFGHDRPPERVNEPYFSKTRDLLGKVRGIEIDRPDECCGFGGSFCVTDEAVSAKMGYDRAHDFHRHGAEYIALADMTCLLHMKGVIDRLKLPMKVIDIAQILNGGPPRPAPSIPKGGPRALSRWRCTIPPTTAWSGGCASTARRRSPACRSGRSCAS